ncbi:baculoviral IAP repeat-containing protein 7-B-like [Microplitis mediator]|uniref:baculoviral IAP repeat-containing protein 7-B-like n=1 Tax=Microplitis mediator TaxID=375433 RepID=UPI002554A7AB|nr:baculoviral IAP repeat-containing protein 7-B-like [Microplitis mediator]
MVAITIITAPMSQDSEPSRRPPTLPLVIGNRSTSHIEAPRFIQYASEQRRLETFVGWTGPPTLPRELAAAGFFYLGNGDQVTCYECALRIERWEEGDDPIVAHRRWQTNCRFVQTLPRFDITIATGPPPTEFRQSSLLLGGNRIIAPTPPTELNLPQPSPVLKLGHLNLAKPRGPMYPECSSYDRRLETFRDWPLTNAQSKEQLAEAGFFYINQNDQTLCYHCGGGLKHWVREDDPWVEHARWFNKCYWLWSVKGQAFVDRVQDQPGDSTTSESSEPSEQDPQVFNFEPDTFSEEGSDAATIVEPTWEPKDQGLCKICFNEDLGIVFLPCGHLVACTKCAPSLTRCAVCREPIILVARAVIS